VSRGGELFEVFAVVMIEVLSESLLDTITRWPILVGNALGAAAMIACCPVIIGRHGNSSWQRVCEDPATRARGSFCIAPAALPAL
jgi:hypothetical protein